jgi:hypothetical protein
VSDAPLGVWLYGLHDCKVFTNLNVFSSIAVSFWLFLNILSVLDTINTV